MVQYEKKWAVKTEPAAVLFYMENFRVEGTLFRPPGLRVTDAINQTTGFIALKDATVYRLDSETPVLTKEFIAVHRDHILFATEKE